MDLASPSSAVGGTLPTWGYDNITRYSKQAKQVVGIACLGFVANKLVQSETMSQLFSLIPNPYHVAENTLAAAKATDITKIRNSCFDSEYCYFDYNTDKNVPSIVETVSKYGIMDTAMKYGTTILQKLSGRQHFREEDRNVVGRSLLSVGLAYASLKMGQKAKKTYAKDGLSLKTAGYSLLSAALAAGSAYNAYDAWSDVAASVHKWYSVKFETKELYQTHTPTSFYSYEHKNSWDNGPRSGIWLEEAIEQGPTRENSQVWCNPFECHKVVKTIGLGGRFYPLYLNPVVVLSETDTQCIQHNKIDILAHAVSEYGPTPYCPA